MPNCKLCGGEIVIRTVGGNLTPTHLSGGCPGEPSSRKKANTLAYKHESDYCQPARCPECKARVFLIRYYGGRVLVDDLTWPWPKHPCLASAKERALLEILHETASYFHGAHGAVVTRVGFFPGADSCLAGIAQPGAGTEFWAVRGIKDPSTLIGALVAISPSDKKLVHPGVAIYDIEEPRWPCAVCGSHFLDSQIEKHMAEKHSYARCRICATFVSRNQLETHLNEHKLDANEREEYNPPLRSASVNKSGKKNCPRGHGALHMWEGTAQCRSCGWPFK